MEEAFDDENIPVKGDFEELLYRIDIILDAAPAGIGAKNKEKYEKKGLKAVFQGGEINEAVDVFFHGYANYK